MYSQADSFYKSANSHMQSKRSKSYKVRLNELSEQFNHTYRNKNLFSPDGLFDKIKELTIDFVQLAAIQVPKKIPFQDILMRNLSLGNLSKNKKIVFFHIKLAELYLKSQLDFNVLLRSVDCLNQFYLLENNFHQFFCLNLKLLPSIQNQKLRQSIQKAVIFLFKFIDIQENQKHQTFINCYLSQSVLIQNFEIYFQITCAYYQKLREKRFNYPFIDVNFILKKLFDFEQSQKQEFQAHYMTVLTKYNKLFEVEQYLPYLARDFQNIFLLITQWADKSDNKDVQLTVIYFYNVIMDNLNKKLSFSIPEFKIEQKSLTNTSGQKLHFFMTFYMRMFVKLDKKSLSQINFQELLTFSTIIENNIQKIIVANHNFIRVVDKIVNEIEKLKRNSLRQFLSNDKTLTFNNQKNRIAIQILFKLTEIQHLILTNKIYLALDNFKNSAYFTTSGLIEVITHSYFSQKGISIDQILKKWVNKISSLNLQPNDVETFYVQILNILTKKYKNNESNTQQNSLLFKCFQFLLENQPKFLSSKIPIIHCWSFIVKKIIDNLSQRSQENSYQIALNQQIQGYETFIKKITAVLCKNAFQYFENISKDLQQIEEIKEDSKFTYQIELISFSILLFCLNHKMFTNQEITNFLRIFSIGFQNQKFGQIAALLKKDIFEKLQTYIFMIVENSNINAVQMNFQQFQFFLSFYQKLRKTLKEDKQNEKLNTQIIYRNLRTINFIFSLKKSLNSGGNSTQLKEVIQNFQLSVLGELGHAFIDMLFYSEDLQQIDCREKMLQLKLDILVKKIYLTTHPQHKGLENLNLSNEKSGYGQFDQSKQEVDQNKEHTKRQRRQKKQKQFQTNVINFENSCILIGRAKLLLSQVFASIIKNLQQYPCQSLSSQPNVQFIKFHKEQFINFQNVSNLLGFLWNVLWMLKICDMKEQIKDLLKLRLGIFNYFSQSTSNRAFLSLQLQKLKYFGLIEELKDDQKQAHSYQQRLLRNELSQSEVQKLKYRVEIAIYALNNLSSSKNFQPLVGFFSAYVFQLNRLSTESISKSNVHLYPFHQLAPVIKKSNFRKQNQLYAEYLNFDPTEILYPLMTKMMRKLIYFVKKNNQLSEIESLLGLLTRYFSKTGLAIYFDQIVDLWLIKNIKISTIKVIDCYQMFLNNSLKNEQKAVACEKMKVFSKIDRMLFNKRRSVSALFNIQTIMNLLNQIRDGEFPMGQSICKIIMKQFQQQFNLYNYEVEVMLGQIYPNPNQYRGLSRSDSLILQRLYEIAKKVVLEKAYFKNLIEQNFNYSFQSLYFLNENIVKFTLMNFQIGKIAENLIGYFIELIDQFSLADFKPNKFLEIQKLIDQTLVKLALTMIQFNYEYKTFVYGSEDVESFVKQQIVMIASKLENNKRMFANFQDDFENDIQGKLQFLGLRGNKRNSRECYSHLRFPLSIIYPLRQYVYNMALMDNLLITKVDMFKFDHSLSKVQQFIDNDSQILYKEKSAKSWWVGRTRLDRQMGKIAESTDLGVFDVKVQDHLKLRSTSSESFNKFIYSNNLQQTKNHIKNILERECVSMGKQQQIFNEISKMQQLLMVDEGTSEQSLKINQSILILTTNRLSVFPFQKVKSLQRYKGVYRVPSVKYVMDQQMLRQRIQPRYSIRNLSYAVNIHDNLKQTERRFLKIKDMIEKKASTQLRWSGIIGKQPCKSQYLSYFSSEVYVYMGHGSGLGQFKQRELYQCNFKSLTMFFGCSSVNMDHRSSEQHGIPLIVLKNNCPALLGANWQITDADTDHLTRKIFQNILSEREVDLSVCLQQCKKTMKLSNLNGSAIVVYGLPCKIQF